MNRIDYNQSGGFPLSTQILAAAQDAYKTFNQLGHLAGNNLIIVAGVEEGAGGAVSDGFVVIDGELLPFQGGIITAGVTIMESSDLRGFEDGSAKPVIYTRYATFAVDNGAYPWASFRRPKTLFQLEDRLAQLEKAVPVGLVAIWGRPADEIPAGWVEHTDLAGRVPVGHAPGDLNFGSLDNTIGAAQITLDISQIPAHNHNVSFGTEKVGTGNPNGLSAQGNSGGHVRSTDNKGGGQPHSNIQPSRIVKYIRFIGF